MYVTNHALAHVQKKQVRDFTQRVEEELGAYWGNRTATSHPKFKIFQNARDCHGKRMPNFNPERFRQSNMVLRKVLVDGHGFRELDEWLLTAGLLEKGHSDGWHFSGSVKRMEAIIFVNMICNQY